VPQAYCEDYVAIAVAHLAPLVGRPAPVIAEIEARLRRAAISGPRGQALAEAKITASHDALVAQGMVSWASGAIPLAYSEDYVALAANLLAPLVGKPMADMGAIEGRLRRGALSGARGQALAEAKVTAVHDAMNAQGLVSWASSAIPLAHAEDYAMMAANLLAPLVGKPMSDMMPVEARVRRASLLRTAPALAEQAVMDVHAVLDARGKTRWSSLNIPDYAASPYVLMASNLVAPQFGLPVDMMAEARAMRELAQVIALPSSGETVRADYY